MGGWVNNEPEQGEGTLPCGLCRCGARRPGFETREGGGGGGGGGKKGGGGGEVGGGGGGGGGGAEANGELDQ